MDIRLFGKFLLILAMGFFIGAIGVIGYQYEYPQRQTDQASKLRSIVVDNAMPYLVRLDARHRLDAMYEADEKLPQSTNYLFIAAGITAALGIGLLLSSKPTNGPLRKVAPSEGDIKVYNPETATENNYSNKIDAILETVVSDKNKIKKSVAEQLTEISQLKDAGHLTDLEFDIAKTRILA